MRKTLGWKRDLLHASLAAMIVMGVSYSFWAIGLLGALAGNKMMATIGFAPLVPGSIIASQIFSRSTDLCEMEWEQFHEADSEITRLRAWGCHSDDSDTQERTDACSRYLEAEERLDSCKEKTDGPAIFVGITALTFLGSFITYLTLFFVGIRLIRFFKVQPKRN